MRAVNLLPKDSGRNAGKTPKPLVLVGVVGGALLLAVLGAGFFVTSSGLSQKEEELAAKQSELALMPRPEEDAPRQSSEDAALAAERGPRAAAVVEALGQRVSWDRILRRFSLVLPDDVWLQSLALTGPAPGAAAVAAAGTVPTDAAAATGFSVSGRTYSHDGVARLLARMTALPDLENVQLQTSHVSVVSEQKVVEFTIVAGVRTDGETS